METFNNFNSWATQVGKADISANEVASGNVNITAFTITHPDGT